MKKSLFVIFFLLLLAAQSCRNGRPSEEVISQGEEVPIFDADSAMVYLNAQCSFGPRVMNSEAHEACGIYIENKFREYGFHVHRQEAEFLRYDGLKMKGYNIIAQQLPEATDRPLVAAHWDSRPWADNDPDERNWKSPVIAANDGASGVAVMIELARQISIRSPQVAIDFVCFDAEDVGIPQWENSLIDRSDTWCLGAQLWAKNLHSRAFRFGILLDMVGGRGAYFYREGYSQRYAAHVVEMVWNAARASGNGSFFIDDDSGFVTDDHVPVNRDAHIPMVDILPYYPTAESGFGPTWHTVSDTPDNIDPNTLKAVGQTLLHLIYNQQP